MQIPVADDDGRWPAPARGRHGPAWRWRHIRRPCPRSGADGHRRWSTPGAWAAPWARRLRIEPAGTAMMRGFAAGQIDRRAGRYRAADRPRHPGRRRRRRRCRTRRSAACAIRRAPRSGWPTISTSSTRSQAARIACVEIGIGPRDLQIVRQGAGAMARPQFQRHRIGVARHQPVVGFGDRAMRQRRCRAPAAARRPASSASENRGSHFPAPVPWR